jgi:CDP-glycerol glycerophosphotransferase (TagB/SpsB family)
MNSNRITYENVGQEIFIKELEEILAKLKSNEGYLQSNRLSLEEKYSSHFSIGHPRYPSFLKPTGEKEFVVEFTVKVW